MPEAARDWTREEQQKLFDVYFGPLPGLCAVCGTEVCMIMTQMGRRVSLSLSCEGCGNKAIVSRDLPLQGPLHPPPDLPLDGMAAA